MVENFVKAARPADKQTVIIETITEKIETGVKVTTYTAEVGRTELRRITLSRTKVSVRRRPRLLPTSTDL